MAFGPDDCAYLENVAVFSVDSDLVEFSPERGRSMVDDDGRIFAVGQVVGKPYEGLLEILTDGTLIPMSPVLGEDVGYLCIKGKGVGRQFFFLETYDEGTTAMIIKTNSVGGRIGSVVLPFNEVAGLWYMSDVDLLMVSDATAGFSTYDTNLSPVSSSFTPWDSPVAVTADGALWQWNISDGSVRRNLNGSITSTGPLGGTGFVLTFGMSLCSPNSIYFRRGSLRWQISPDMVATPRACTAPAYPSPGFFYSVQTNYDTFEITLATCGLPPEVPSTPPLRMRQRDDSFNTPRMRGAQNSPSSFQESLRMTWNGAYLRDEEPCLC